MPDAGPSAQGCTRRDVLKAGAAGGAALASWSLTNNLIDALAASPACGSLKDIEHVVIFIQENRSFDHYFGTYRGVRGFDDHPKNSFGFFAQPGYTAGGQPAPGHLLPYHLDTSSPSFTKDAYCTADITHDWVPQHASWNGGAMDGFVKAHLAEDPKNGPLTMGYYERADAPFFHAVADAFTLCDNYFCSVIGPTDPNRLYTFSAWLGQDGANGGPVLRTRTADRLAGYGKLSWRTMPEGLQDAGISWKVYSTQEANLLNNVLLYFKQYQDPTSPLSQKAFLPTFPVEFQADCASGNLPQVSWILAPLITSEHPPGPPRAGEFVLKQTLDALTANPAVWAKTALFVTYDENGGFFDHVAPPTPPSGTAGEYVIANPLPPEAGGVRGPIGLGFRVPMLVISPFSRGGFVSSGVFDHTSTLRFLETRFGVPVPNLTAWRRNTVGDLTSAFNFKQPDQSVPSLPGATPLDLAQAAPECALEGPNALGVPAIVAFPPPNPQHMPSQESGSAKRPSGVCGEVAAPSSTTTSASGLGLPGTGAPAPTAHVPGGLAVGALALAAALLLRLRRRREVR